MAPEFVEHIFEPFTRFENSTTNKIQGTGLGMAITKSIVDMNGGSIRIQSELGKGSRFEVDLTFEIDKEAKPEIEIKSVLLITREEQLIRNVSAAFKESDMELSAAASVEQAQTLLEEHPVQAIVLNGFTKKEALSDAVRRLPGKNSGGNADFLLRLYAERRPAGHARRMRRERKDSAPVLHGQLCPRGQSGKGRNETEYHGNG